ncbi:MAG TPA: hypothetical protein PJ991_12380, partial [Kiritimatiellia bacterium]|nr:hypothetical protein [Kiritimatiellia bacterium]
MWYRACVSFLFLFFPVSAWCDGIVDGRIGEIYGSTRAIDVGNDITGDGECANTAGRGNLMDFYAVSLPGTPGQTNDPWHFAWTIDSSHPLDTTTGDFFGMPATVRVNYIIGIETGCTGAPRLEMWQNGQPWEREFAWNVHYFVAMFAVSPDTMEAQLWRNDGGNNRSMIQGGIAVTSRVVGLRRQFELSLPATSTVPPELRNNSTLCLYLVSVEDIEADGKVLDGVGMMNHNINCPGAGYDLTTLGAIFINTELNAKSTGRPTAPGSNDRQSLSLSRRDIFNTVNGQGCSAPFGVNLAGTVDPVYTLLTEAGFAAPYTGGASDASDFFGESAARTYTYVRPDGTTTSVVLPVATSAETHGDIRNVHVYGDTNYFYVIVTGPTGLGWENEPDRFNLYVAIDMPGQNSGNDAGGLNDLAPGDATAPASRLVNFKGWDPDHVLELVWRADTFGQTPANLYNAIGPGAWSSPLTFTYTNVANTATAPVRRYYSRSWPWPANPIYEFAIPWTNLARSTPPAPMDVIRIGVYTTGDENIENSSVSRWDVADQAPGVGQGCHGEGCHERIGDDAFDDDSLTSNGQGDRTPYDGRSYGVPGYPPATDNSTNDVDTIESYFAFRLMIQNCNAQISIEKSTNGQDADNAPG